VNLLRSIPVLQETAIRTIVSDTSHGYGSLSFRQASCLMGRRLSRQL
jgi:hypothetical protein